MNELIAVSTGLFAGTITGIVPGAGVMVAMIVASPLLMHFDVLQLLLFYMSLASMVQFTGTIPAVYLGVPGETNSLPAVIEGTQAPQVKVCIDPKGDIFSYMDAGFTGRKGVERYCLGNVNNSSLEQQLKKMRKITPKKQDTAYLDAYNHLIQKYIHLNSK